jgi:MtN3 and saliva related transmembrane protein
MKLEFIGYIAAALTATTMAPQIIKSIRTKEVEDISITMIMMYVINTGLWTIYGASIGAIPVVIADSLAFLMGTTQLYLKLAYKK